MAEIFATARTNLSRSGHALCYCPPLKALVAFGGILTTTELLDEEAASVEISSSPLYILPVSHIVELANSVQNSECQGLRDFSVRWERRTSSAMPRTRHGHVMVSHGDDVFVFGGCHWAHGDVAASSDLRYMVQTNSWRPFDSQIPSRFCAASACTAQGEVFLFGGIAGREKEPTNAMHRISLSDFTVHEPPQLGQVPPPQFKSSMAVLNDGGSLVHFEGLTAGDARALMAPSGTSSLPSVAKVCHMYTMHTGIWRQICQSPDIVRSQVVMAPHFRPASLAAREAAQSNGQVDGTAFMKGPVELVTLFGGMHTFPGAQFRTAQLFVFNVTHRMWEPAHSSTAAETTAGGHGRREARRHLRGHGPPSRLPPTGGAGGGVSAHAVANFALSDELFEAYGIVSCSHGGNTDRDETCNNRGEQTDVLRLFRQRTLSLKEITARWIHRWRIPYVLLQADPLLDELF
jgi:hypothetical protein